MEQTKRLRAIHRQPVPSTVAFMVHAEQVVHQIFVSFVNVKELSNQKIDCKFNSTIHLPNGRDTQL